MYGKGGVDYCVIGTFILVAGKILITYHSPPPGCRVSSIYPGGGLLGNVEKHLSNHFHGRQSIYCTPQDTEHNHFLRPRSPPRPCLKHSLSSLPRHPQCVRLNNANRRRSIAPRTRTAAGTSTASLTAWASGLLSAEVSLCPFRSCDVNRSARRYMLCVCRSRFLFQSARGDGDRYVFRTCTALFFLWYFLCVARALPYTRKVC